MDQDPLRPHSPLARYVRTRAPDAFAAMVRPYLDLIYSVARRQVADPHLAEDVAQAVLIILSDKAGCVPGDAALPAWLFRTTRHVGRNALRAAARRQLNERKAAMMRTETLDQTDGYWDQLAPELDAAVASLASRDRHVVLLRYYGHKTLREVAQTLGMTEEAARKRTARAVERLRQYFQARGVAVPAAALDAALVACAAQPAPHTIAAFAGGGAVGASANSAVSASAAALAASGAGPSAMAGALLTKALAAAVTLALLGAGAALVADRTPATQAAPAALPPAASDTPAATSQPAPFTAQFDSGHILRILAVGTGSPPKAWRGPDGQPLAQSPLNANRPIVMRLPRGQPDLDLYRLIIGIEGPPMTEADASVRAEPSNMIAWVVEQVPGRGQLLIVDVGVPRGTRQIDLLISVLPGPWRTIAHAPVADQPVTSPLPGDAAGGSVTFGPPVPAAKPGHCTILITQTQQDRRQQYRYVAASGDRQVIGAVRSMRSSSNGPAERTVEFPCDAAAVDGVLLQVRDYSWKTIPAVQLQP